MYSWRDYPQDSFHETAPAPRERTSGSEVLPGLSREFIIRLLYLQSLRKTKSALYSLRRTNIHLTRMQVQGWSCGGSTSWFFYAWNTNISDNYVCVPCPCQRYSHGSDPRGYFRLKRSRQMILLTRAAAS